MKSPNDLDPPDYVSGETEEDSFHDLRVLCRFVRDIYLVRNNSLQTDFDALDLTLDRALFAAVEIDKTYGFKIF